MDSASQKIVDIVYFSKTKSDFFLNLFLKINLRFNIFVHQYLVLFSIFFNFFLINIAVGFEMKIVYLLYFLTYLMPRPCRLLIFVHISKLHTALLIYLLFNLYVTIFFYYSIYKIILHAVVRRSLSSQQELITNTFAKNNKKSFSTLR